MKLRLPILAALVGLILGSTASADTIYLDRSLFLAATTGDTNITFDGLAPVGFYTAYGHGPLTLAGVVFDSIGTDLTFGVNDPGWFSSSYPSQFLLPESPYGVTPVLNVALPSAMTAVGFDLGGLFPRPEEFAIILSNGSSAIVGTVGSIASTQLDFFGIVTTTPFTSLKIEIGDPPYTALDNFTFGNPWTAVPEPATFFLMGAGLLAAGLSSRLRKRA